MKIRTIISKTCTAIKMLAIGSVFLVVAGGIVWQGGRNFQVAMEDEESLQVQVQLAKNLKAYKLAKHPVAPVYAHGTFDVVDGGR